MVYRDRTDAGTRLAELLGHLRDQDAAVLALPRGGVVVGYEIAVALGAPLDVVVARKLGAPNQPEFGFGAVAAGDVRVLDAHSVRMLGLSAEQIDHIAAREMAEMGRREALYRSGRDPLVVEGRTVILVDDGLATGVTARAAVRAIRVRQPRRVVLAVPVAPPDTVRAFAAEVDEIVCPEQPRFFQAVGKWYANFAQTADGEVAELLERARRAAGGAAAIDDGGDP